MAHTPKYRGKWSLPIPLRWPVLLIAMALLLVGSSFIRAAAAEPSAYNVRDYGARGDGSSDDTAAIQKAIDSAGSTAIKTVFIPAGNYLVTAASVPVGEDRPALWLRSGI